MKKLIFKKFAKDIFQFFLLVSLSISLIVWVIQAVNFLDIVTEDGHGFKVYFLYTLLSLPKIFSKILPFIYFVSIFYIILKYENNNELIIFWTIGIKKLDFINVLLIFSIFYVILQLLLTAFVVPKTLDKARSYIRSSNLDLYSSIIQEKKLIDAVNNLTIFIEEKNNNGELKNVFLKEKIAKNIKLALVVPGSGLVKLQAESEGLDKVFKNAGFEWREPGCSMCLGMNADKLGPGERCASTSNRNFEGRQGQGGRTHLVSPQMAAAAAIYGKFVDIRELN